MKTRSGQNRIRLPLGFRLAGTRRRDARRRRESAEHRRKVTVVIARRLCDNIFSWRMTMTDQDPKTLPRQRGPINLAAILMTFLF